MKLVYGRSDEVATFVAEHIEGCSRGFGNCKAIGIANDAGELVAGMVFHNWDPESGVIEISSASIDPRWLTSETRHKMFSYPFDEVGCQMVVLRVGERNKRMVRIAKAYGFTGHLIPRLKGRDEGQFVFTMTDDAWRSSRFHSKELRAHQAREAGVL